jgi:hypothetical protein
MVRDEEKKGDGERGWCAREGWREEEDRRGK